MQVSKFLVRFYKACTTIDRHAITVEANSPKEARAKVKGWGKGEGELTEAEEETEDLERDGDIDDTGFRGLLELDSHVPAVEEVIEPEDIFTVRSSYADIKVHRATGEIIEINYAAMGGKDEWEDVDHFDPATFPAGESENDCLRTGFWTKSGKYVAPVNEEMLHG